AVVGLLERSQHHLLEWSTEPRRSIVARTKLRATGITQVARHQIDESQAGVAEPCRRRIAETNQQAVDLDDVVRRLEIEPAEKREVRRPIEADGPVRRDLGFERLPILIEEIAPARKVWSLGAAVERHACGLRVTAKAGIEQFFRAGTRHWLPA